MNIAFFLIMLAAFGTLAYHRSRHQTVLTTSGVLAIIAMLFWANAMVKREKGIQYKIGPRLFAIAMVIVFHWFFTDSN